MVRTGKALNTRSRSRHRVVISEANGSVSLSRASCGRRVAILYCSRYFVCRHCLNLSYESQKENAIQRVDRRAWALRERCGGWGSLFDPFPGRPKGMHRRTYRDLRSSMQRNVKQASGHSRRDLEYARRKT